MFLRLLFVTDITQVLCEYKSLFDFYKNKNDGQRATNKTGKSDVGVGHRACVVGLVNRQVSDVSNVYRTTVAILMKACTSSVFCGYYCSFRYDILYVCIHKCT